MNSYSQIKQDEWILTKLNHKKNGFFVDIGAFDGIELSNTYILEDEYGWNGICLECNPEILPTLSKNRKVTICDRPISNIDNETYYIHSVSKEDPMLCYVSKSRGGLGSELKKSITLNTLLEQHNAPKDIDYISLDVEGIELPIIQNFDFSKYNVKCWTIEHNLIPSDQQSLNNFFNIAFILLKNNYLIKWHDWDIFAIKDDIEPDFIVNGERVK